jgi:hypothetical protein
MDRPEEPLATDPWSRTVIPVIPLIVSSYAALRPDTPAPTMPTVGSELEVLI